MDAKTRKHRYKLKCSGYAVIAFGAWSIIRVFMMKYLNPLGLENMLGSSEYEAGYEPVIFIFFIVILAFDLLFRLYIGRNAIREGNGERRRLTYVVLAALYVGVSIWSDFSYIVGLFSGKSSSDVLAAIIVDLTTCVALVEITVSSLYLRKLGKGKTA